MKIQSWISVICLVICTFYYFSLSKKIAKMKRIDIKNKYDIKIKIDKLKAVKNSTITIKLSDDLLNTPEFYMSGDTAVYSIFEFKTDSIL
jgi:hypothetical protein